MMKVRAGLGHVTPSEVEVWACPGPNAAGSGYPLQVLARKASLRAFRFYPSRKKRSPFHPRSLFLFGSALRQGCIKIIGNGDTSFRQARNSTLRVSTALIQPSQVEVDEVDDLLLHISGQGFDPCYEFLG